jgi:aryl-alcohol dehydrogenase-like predicted oxidoreductase
VQAPGVTAPIIGATKTNHLKEAFEAVDIKLSAEESRRSKSPTGRIPFSATNSRNRGGWSQHIVKVLH